MASEKKWTKEQNDAITARGGTLLVSAAAGSGKTAVLVERVIGLITDEKNPCNADRLLVVTFTNAAASEMRERISQRISDMIEENPLDANLQRQQMLLQNSHISTIHSFCLDVLRENFEKLDIPSDFRIADDNEDKILRDDVLSEILENRYAAAIKSKNGESGESFLLLSHLLSTGRDDSALADTILKLYDFVRSLDDAENWLDSIADMYDPNARIKDTVWGKIAEQYIKEALESAKKLHQRVLLEMSSDEKIDKAYSPAFESDVALINGLIETAQSGDWDSLREKIATVSFARLGSLRKPENENLRDRLKEERDGIKKSINELGENLLCCSENEFAEDLKKLRPAVLCLCDIVRELDREFFAAKLKKGVLDFSDLEQLTLKLLVKRENGKVKFTQTAKEISTHFDEILVDEYQDTNPAQDLIFHAVSRNSQNLFMVGDVKQSIYSFRQARPEIFLNSAKNCKPYGENIFPAKIILGKNFRSRKGVTDAVNFVFKRLMSEQFGGVDYGKDEALVAGAQYFSHDENDFELDVIDSSIYDGEEDGVELEAAYIAAEIKRMISDGYEVQDKTGVRKATYRDFCILLRSSAGRAEKYTRALENEGIPAYAQINSGYLGAYEVMVMISFLKIIDNPLQDVPLLSVLLSPVFGFTPDDVSEIRLKNRKKSLYFALVELSKSGDTRFDGFLKLVDKLRQLAAVLTADRLILRIYDETGLLNIFEAMPNGEMRMANLRLLLNYARSFESAGYRGLAGFIRFIDRVDRQKSDLMPATGVSENADVVRVMTIHKSKGLEFPVCFLANLTKQYNAEDTKGSALFHPDCGFGCNIKDERLGCHYTTLPREAVKLESRKSMLSEEMRVLYVAMTRAKEKLICVLTFKGLQKPLSRAAQIARSNDKKASPYEEMSAMNPAELILSAALLHPSCSELRSLAGGDFNVLESDDEWKLNLVNAKTIIKNEENVEEEIAEQSPETEIIKKQIEEKLSYEYPFEELEKIPTKVSVSELVHNEKPDFDALSLRPSFLEGENLTPAEKGTALHAFMQYCSFKNICGVNNIKKEAERLVFEKYLLAEQGNAVDINKVAAFADSPLFNRIIVSDKFYREFRFNIEVPAKEIYPESETETSILLQGMADLVFIEKDSAVIVDYKTDRVKSADELSERYKKQLDLYSAAVSKILQKPIKEKYIYSFYLNKAFKV